MTRVVHCKRDPFDVYIGRAARGFRASKWGNPFAIGMDPMRAAQILDGAFRASSAPGAARIAFDGLLTREKAIECFEAWLRLRTDLLDALPELRGKVLGCWCAPQPCHGDVLARLADAPTGRAPEAT